jgi:tetratricopeptide (TPR) repeat protein
MKAIEIRLLAGHFGAILLAAGALGGCGGLGLSVSEPDPNIAATSTNIASLTEVVQRNPNDPQAYNVRGAVLGRAGRNEEALADFNKAITINPKFAAAYANRGLVHRQMRKLDLALADYDKALGLEANYALAYLGRGQVYRAQGRALDALNDYNRAIQMTPSNGQAYYQRGLLYQAQGQHQFAVDDFSTALGLIQQQAEPFVARGLSWLALGDAKAAMGDGEVVQPPEVDTLITASARPMPRPPTMRWPRVVTETLLMTVVSGTTIDDACREAFKELLDWIESEYGLPRQDAAMLMGMVAQTGLCSLSNTLHTAKCRIGRSWLGL